MGLDASLLAEHMYVRMASTDSLRTDVWVRLEVMPYADEGIHGLGTFALFALHLFFAVRIHKAADVGIPYLIDILEELQTKMQGIISSHNYPQHFCLVCPEGGSCTLACT